MNRYKLMRYERGLSISDVATGAKLSRPTVTGVEALTDERDITASTAAALARFYGLDMPAFLGLKKEAA